MTKVLTLLKPMKLGAFSILNLIRKHYYFFVLIIFLIPTILGSVGQAIDEGNPSIPFLDLGLFLANADAQIAEDVTILKENPVELIGAEKPINGIWKTIVYYWKLFWNVIMRELGLIWAIAFPFIIIFKILRHRNQSESGKNVILTVVYGLMFVLVINLVLIVRGLVSGDLVPVLQEGLSFNQQSWIVVVQALPFHGLISLIQFLINLSVAV